MGQEIATRDDGFAVGKRGGAKLVKGIIVKFTGGVFKANSKPRSRTGTARSSTIRSRGDDNDQ